MLLKKNKMVQWVCVGGLLTSLAVLLQSAPVFLPALGLALSPFSTLPVAIAAVFHLFLGIAVLFSTVIILMIISPQEAIIFLFTTGLLGTVLGALLHSKSILVSILASATALLMGILILTYMVAIPVFVNIVHFFKFPLTLLVFILFSLIYTSIWYLCLKKYEHRFRRMKLL